jgi:hypothetical protein
MTDGPPPDSGGDRYEFDDAYFSETERSGSDAGG